MCVLLLAAPAAVPDNGKFRPDVPADGVVATGFAFESGVLPIGEYAPTAVEGQLFDPQTDISAQEYEHAGLQAPMPRPEEIAEKMQSTKIASFPYDPEGRFVEQLGSLALEREFTEMMWTPLPQYQSEILPSAYAVEVTEGSCVAYLDTHRGSLYAAVSAVEEGLGYDVMCDRAFGILERLYLAHPAQ